MTDRQDGPIPVQVAVSLPVQRLLTYLAPPSLADHMEPGTAVLVPVGSRQVLGHVIGHSNQRDAGEGLKLISRILPEQESMDPQTMELLLWAAAYYHYPPGEALRHGLGGHRPAMRRRYRLSTKGADALDRSRSLLAVQGMELSEDEQRILSRLLSAAGPITKTSVLRDTATNATVLDRLVRRGFVDGDTKSQSGPKARTVSVITVNEDLAESDRERLARRAPKMWAVLQAIQSYGGRATTNELRRIDRHAAARVRTMAEKGLVHIESHEETTDPFARLSEQASPIVDLNQAQQQAVDRLITALKAQRYQTFLLHGVTGSGKTEVYLHLIAEALKRNQKALVLVPEIALTPQLAGRFHSRFPNLVAILHSGLTQAERRDQWAAIRLGTIRIVVGARSALFAPIGPVGVVVIDEEHDPSFKQQDGLRYNGRDLALVRARQSNAVVVLGSATPSLESYHNALSGRYELLRLPDRATPRPLPHVEIVDMRKYQAEAGAFTAPLLSAMAETLEAHNQAICFLNRRGFSPYLICKQCGEAVRCPDCSVSLTWHRKQNLARCHYCGHAVPTPQQCEACGAPDLMPIGLGTEKLVSLLQKRFPEARIARLDRDTAQFGRMNMILDHFRNRDIDILVGTQMVAKGHDFPGVTMVGVILADHGLNFPDFRAAERTYQLLSQVAGRAGRGTTPGRVVIQTYNPQHHAVLAAKNHDYEAFYQAEIRLRKELGYPPTGYLAAVRFEGKEEADVARTANEVATWLKDHAQRRADILGPSQAPLARLRGNSRWHLLVKTQDRPFLHRLMSEFTATTKAQHGVRATLDIDPQDML
ncbi:MAG: primosomal protein N' [Deltaproteobacteria bacterium]|nr:primosomal protein N' [Deltaproteobacteria bacterium]